MPPPMPPPPETPQQKYNRLYPSAGDIAKEQAYGTLAGRLQAVMEAIRQSQTETEKDLVRGLSGAPRRQTKHDVWNADYQTADGQMLTGSVVFNPDDGSTTVGGEPVTVLKRYPNTPARPIGVNVAGPGGTVNRQFRDPYDPAGPPIGEIPTGLRQPAGPPDYSGTVTTPEGIFQVDPREGGRGPRLGDAPPRAGDLDLNQSEALQWKTDVDVAVKSALSQRNVGKPSVIADKALPETEVNKIVLRISRGRFQSYGQLVAATKRQTGSTGSTGGGDARREGANRVRRRLEAQDPGRVQGEGMPPGPPGPPED